MKYAVIGGSVLSRIGKDAQTNRVTGDILDTPYGKAAEMMIFGISGREVVYFNRHGNDHHIAPHRINYRANIYALKQLGVSHIIASAAVGGISAEMAPLQLVIPDQLIDYSYGREHTYSDGSTGTVNHIDFSYPFDDALRQQLVSAANREGTACIEKATYGVTQGPRLETAAEIQRMHNDGCDIVGMTAMPEAALARELGIAYATLAIVVNRAAGKGEAGEIVSMEEIYQCINTADKTLQKTIETLFE